ncbi:AEC family transporter, partial [Klebsiella pneumoniae]|uniref:AEC family transporter n=2 Tax=Pseudomonadota TaxID=1224 RepID=UPI00254CF167
MSPILAVTAPVFAMVAVGMALRRWKLIDDPFIQTASNLTFRVTMPVLFFLSLWRADIQHSLHPSLILMFAAATLLGFAGSWAWAVRTLPPVSRGVFVQGSFRGNCGVLSFALAASYFGDYGSSVGGVLAGFTILIFNILAVLVLSFYSPTLTF